MLFEDGNQFFAHKSILITGATGFLAKIIVEKILRVSPNVKKLYLLIRARDTTTAHNRLRTEIIQKDVFRVLREQLREKFDSFIAEKVGPIAGDSSLPNLGINNNNTFCHEIDAIIHVAATTRFNERYDVAFSTNTMGAMNIINFADMCSRLQVLIHVSTAYVCGDIEGLITETPCVMTTTLRGESLKIDVERRLIDETLHALQCKAASPSEVHHAMKSLGKLRAQFYGWPNTYVFTKAMAEMIIWKHKKDLPVVVIRPTMICSTLKDPFPGWIEGFGSASMVSIAYGKGLVRLTHGDKECAFDLIPADMVTNCILTAMMANANKPGLTIYQVCSSSSNPITFGELVDFNFQYFDKTPWVDGRGSIVKIKTGRIVKSRVVFLLHLSQQILILMILKLIDIVSCGFFNMGLDKIETQLKATYKVAQLYKPYICFQGIFDDKNTEILRRWMNEVGIDNEDLNFDPKCIDWEDFLLNVHIPATVNYIF